MSSDNSKVKTILFLLNDHDPILLKVVQNKFKKDGGWESIITTTYKDAVLNFEKEDPDAVMTEILINDDSGKTGFDLIQEIKRLEKKEHPVPIVVFTELNQAEDKEKAKKLGANHYFVKSEVTILEVIGQIKNIIKNL